MPTIFSHAVVAVALITAFPEKAVPRRLAVLGAACSMLPDIDALGLQYGVPYGSFFGHRGFTHSLVFAVIVAFVGLLAAPRTRSRMVWLYLFLRKHRTAYLMPTDGGLGVAFFSPFRLHPILLLVHADRSFSNWHSFFLCARHSRDAQRVYLGLASIHRACRDGNHLASVRSASPDYNRRSDLTGYWIEPL